jgi:hypothetical protein
MKVIITQRVALLQEKPLKSRDAILCAAGRFAASFRAITNSGLMRQHATLRVCRTALLYSRLLSLAAVVRRNLFSIHTEPEPLSQSPAAQ